MSGKAYTMKEMKAIVEYLTEHRAYGEIKGRKMWIDFANSNLTTRTWQSLKETFLKRILPDITNPYYKLTVKQIASFRQGSDIEARLNNKLEIRTADEDSNSNDAQDKDPQTSKSKSDNEVHEPGEGPQLPGRNRSSTDTVVIEPCYNTAEEIQKELESPVQKVKYRELSPKVPQAKSIRDYITYSEPLTPILQEVLHDFETDDEEDGSDKEPKMQIVEYPEANISNDNLTPSEMIDTENNDGEDGNKKKENQNDIMHEETSTKKNTESNVITVQDSTETDCIEISDDTPLNNSDGNINDLTKKNDDNPGAVNGSVEPNPDIQIQRDSVDPQRDSQNQSIPPTDTLPNNQEAYKELCDTKKNDINKEHSEISSIQNYLNNSGKRSKSQEIQSDTLIKRLRSGKHQKSSSDVDVKARKKKHVKTKLGKKKNIRNENEEIKKDNNESVKSNESRQYSPKNIGQIPVNTESVCLLEDINKQQITAEANKIEKEKTPISTADQNQALVDQEDASEIIKSTQEAEGEKGFMHQNCNQTSEHDINNRTSMLNETQKTAKLDKDDTSRKSKYKQVSKEGKVTTDNYIKEVINDVVILKSHSDSASEIIAKTQKKHKATRRVEHKRHRDKALANIFGFSSGLGTSRKKTMKHRKRVPSYRMENTTDSDEWTSDTESEYVSPPRGRKHRQRRKYLKPKSAKILSLDEEGGLFIVYGDRVIPLVKDGKIVKNYTTFSPDNTEDDSFWKLKYVEEKKKTEELTKLLKENKKLQSVSMESEVPVAMSVGKSPTPLNIPKESDAVTNKQIAKRQSIFKETEKINQEVGETNTVKIKYTKNNEEVQLEGHWSHVHPVLEHLVHILYKDQEQTNIKSVEIEKPTTENEKPTAKNEMPITENKKLLASKEKVNPTERKRKSAMTKPKTVDNDASETQQNADAKKLPDENQKASGNSSPVMFISLEDDVQDKINKIEEKIFKEIEEREKVDSILENTTTTNVTQRKGLRPKRSSSVVDQASAAKKSRVSSGNNKTPTKDEALQEKNKNIQADVTRQTRTPNKAVNTKEVNQNKNENVERRVTRKSLQDAQNKYNFRSPPATQNQTKVNKKQKAGKRYTVQPARIISPHDTISNASVESSLGYQDSDVSNISMCLRRKRKLSLNVLNKAKAKSQRGSNRKLESYPTESSSDSSSLSFTTAPVKQSSPQSSSLNTEVYRSESYQMLFPQKQNSYKHLDKIEEFSPPLNITYSIDNINSYVMSNLRIEKSENTNNVNVVSPSFANDEDNSTQITLPPSPVLSIVENISVNKNVLSSSNDMPVDMIDEMNWTGLNENMIPDEDIAVPLIGQSCGVQKSKQNEKECRLNLTVAEASQKVSDSFLSKVSAVNIKEPSLSESIHQKLKNLLLESAKKLANHINKSDKNDVINKMEICETEPQQKTKGRKRCSTPRKKQRRHKDKVDNTEQLIQEHTESCGRKNSFPTPLLVVTDASDYKQLEDNSEINAAKYDKPKTRKKKDVIKVKISKPKTKKKGTVSDDVIEKEAKSSLLTDSGINDTESGVYFQGCEDTVDLIHNHSDTCLHAHECVGNSVEVIDENARSIITLNSNSSLVKELKTSKSLTHVTENALLDIFCEDAQDAVNLFTANKKPKETKEASSNFNVSDTNISSLNSLLTDDLSDETVTPTPPEKRNSKWYLLSEDETSNTNLINIASRLPNSNLGCGSNLQQIFPITCAVPDLSTITEEHTPKINTIDTQSLPDVNM